MAILVIDWTQRERMSGATGVTDIVTSGEGVRDFIRQNGVAPGMHETFTGPLDRLVEMRKVAEQLTRLEPRKHVEPVRAEYEDLLIKEKELRKLLV